MNKPTYSSFEQLKWAGWNIPLWIRHEWCPQHGNSSSRRCPVCVGINKHVQEIGDTK